MELFRKRIFIVEDDPYNVGIISRLLETYGAHVRFDSWGGQAKTNILAFAPVDLVLLDLMLSDQSISGYHIYEQIRGLPELRRTRIAIVSASDPDAEMNRARTMGFDGFIPKPINFTRFPSQVARLLNGQQVWGE